MHFSHVVPLNQGTRAEQESIEAQAGKLNLSSDQLSAIRGVVSWGLLLTKRERPIQHQVSELMRLAGGTAGLTNLVRRASQDDTKPVKPLVNQLLQDIAQGSCSPDWLSDSPLDDVRRIYSDLTVSQVKLLQAVVKHRLRLDKLDLSQISRMLPFPLDEGSYLWRFVAGGAQTPAHAVRHLSECTPFLVTMENLIRGLSGEPHHCIELEITGESWDADMSGSGQAIHSVLAVINSSRDFYGPHLGRDKQRLRTISVPRLPFLSTGHIPPSDRPELARALYGWLMFGDVRPEILWRVELSPQRQQLLERWQEQAKKLKASIADTRAAGARTPLGTPPPSDTRRDIDKLEARLRDREKSISEVEDERAQIISIGKQLGSFAKNNRGLREFRKELEKTSAAGCRPVLCFARHPDMEGHAEFSWIEHLDDALAASRQASGDPYRDRVRKALAGCSFLFSPETARELKSSWRRRRESFTKTHFRRFEIAASDCNASVDTLLSGVVPPRTAPELGDLLGTVVSKGLVPGVASVTCLNGLAQRDLKKRRLAPGDYLSYVCETSKSISHDTMLQMLGELHGLGVAKIPERVLDVCESRFGLPRRLFDAYHEYASAYHPERFGSPSSVFTDETSFRAYLARNLDSIGMASELEKLQQALCTAKVVAIVDSTAYYPQFQASSAWAPIVTTEVWGEYVPPATRLVRSLASQVMSGQVPSILQNSSVFVPAVPDPKELLQQKILQMFLGLEAPLGTHQKELHRIVADIARYNEKTIVVLDATQVRNIDDYKRLLATLEHFQLKTILCTRQQFPVESSIFLDPFPRDGLVDRILSDPEALRRMLDLDQAPDPKLVNLAVEQVRHLAPAHADPLHLSLQVLSFAATHAKTLGERSLVRPDLVQATSKIFNIPSPQKTARYREGIESFQREAQRSTLGQEQAIEALSSSMRQHLNGLRPDRSPLVVMLAGPTGTGKTMLGQLLAKNLNLPLMMIEGSQYGSYHMISRLVGSPADYRGPDEGKLFTFIDKNPDGIVFIDEFEKMEASFLPYLMNFLDTGTLESGDGKVVNRPGLTIILASNAGAEQLIPEMETRQVKEIIGEALSHDPEKKMDWLVARMQIIPVLALNLPAFREAIRKSLHNVALLKGVWAANLELVGVDDSACDLLFDLTRGVCRFDQDKASGMDNFGFHSVQRGTGGNDDLFIDMRHVERAATNLIGRSLEQLVLEQSIMGRNVDRTRAWPFKLVGDPVKKEIRAELVMD